MDPEAANNPDLHLNRATVSSQWGGGGFGRGRRGRGVAGEGVTLPPGAGLRGGLWGWGIRWGEGRGRGRGRQGEGLWARPTPQSSYRLSARCEGAWSPRGSVPAGVASTATHLWGRSGRPRPVGVASAPLVPQGVRRSGRGQLEGRVHRLGGGVSNTARAWPTHTHTQTHPPPRVGVALPCPLPRAGVSSGGVGSFRAGGGRGRLDPAPRHPLQPMGRPDSCCSTRSVSGRRWRGWAGRRPWPPDGRSLGDATPTSSTS